MDEVELFESPWVSDTRTLAYFGPVWAQCVVTVDDRDPDTICEALEAVQQTLRERAYTLGGNSVVGLERTLDPFYEGSEGKGLLVHMIGTAAKLAPLYPQPATPSVWW